MNMLIKLSAIILCLTLFACNEQPKQEKAGSTVLRDYVKVPLDKSKIADKKVNRHNRNLKKQLDQIN